MPKTLHAILYLTLLAGLFTACSEDKGNQVYHPLPDRTWYRFNILRFELPVEMSNQPVNLEFYTYHDRNYAFDTLSFNMVLTAPDGAERIRECRIRMKDENGAYTGTFVGDSCEKTLILTRDMVISTDGLLVVELENLIPRVRTEGLRGIGIRLAKP